MTIKFRTDVEPKPAPRPRLSAYTRRVYMPTAYRQYQKQIILDARAAMQGKEPFAGQIACDIAFYASIPASWSKAKKREAIAGRLRPTSRNKGDLDNLMKGVLDSCNGIVYADDSQVVDGSVHKCYSPASPFIVVQFSDVV